MQKCKMPTHEMPLIYVFGVRVLGLGQAFFVLWFRAMQFCHWRLVPRSTSQDHAALWAFTMLEYITTRSMIFGDDFLLKVPWPQANELHHQLVIICGFSPAWGNLRSQLLQIITLYDYTLSRQQGSHLECSSPILLSFSEMVEQVKWFLFKFCVLLFQFSFSFFWSVLQNP